MNSPATGFVFALTNPGSEKALKLELEMAGGGWRFSYQRRGFVTFKARTDEELFTLDSLAVPLASTRRLCLSLGKFATREEAIARTAEISSNAPSAIQHARFFERKMQGVPNETVSPAPAIGALIGTVVELRPEEFWAGVHRHAAFLSPDPGGDPGIVMPVESPSRAWLKLEEAVRFFGLGFTTRDIVAELGCAPGGVVLALLDRGASVIGVDPAKMADVVMKSAIDDRDHAPKDRPWFYHCKKPAALASKRDLGGDTTWFMSDMNQSPEVVLKECARFCRMAPSIHGALMTLKLTDVLEVAAKEQWFAALREMGFKTTRLQQFSAHHKEYALLATR
jgi:23S rRNA (cytidine2498-2'-O)-methyltransferase